MAKKTLLSIVQAVAAELNLPQPTVVISSQDQSVLKLLAQLRSVCDDLLNEFDWEQLQTRYSFTTVSGQEAYSLPADLERFLNGTFFDANNRWPLRGPKTPTEWEWLKAGSYAGAPFSRFRIYGGKFYVAPVPGTTPYTFNFEYVSNAYVQDGGSGLSKQDFAADSDVCLFDHRLAVYGTKVKWLAGVSQDTTAALGDYNRALEFMKGGDAPAPRLSLTPMSAYSVISTMNYPDGSWVT